MVSCQAVGSMTPRQLSWGDRIVAVADWQCPVSLWKFQGTENMKKIEKAFRSTFLENPLKGYERTFKPSSNLRWKKTNGHNWGRNPAFYASIKMDRTRLGILGLHTPLLSTFTIQNYHHQDPSGGFFHIARLVHAG